MANPATDFSIRSPAASSSSSGNLHVPASAGVGAEMVDEATAIESVQPEGAAEEMNATSPSETVRTFRAVPLQYGPEGPHHAWMPDLHQQMVTHELNCFINALRREFNMTVPDELLEEFRAMAPNVQWACLSPPMHYGHVENPIERLRYRMQHGGSLPWEHDEIYGASSDADEEDSSPGSGRW